MPTIATLPPGLTVIENFLTEKEEEELVKEIDKCDWKDNRQKDRKVQIYGPYHTSSYKIIPGKYTAHPEWVKKLAKKLFDALTDKNRFKLLDEKRCEVFVNEYNRSSKLHYHFDHPATYDENIYGVSMGADSFMGFKKGSAVHKASVGRRTLYVMAGESRFQYKHGIPLGWIQGDRRVSVTFRTVK